MLFDVRYAQGQGPKAKAKQATAISPGADTFWECDTGRKAKANFVRARRGPRSWEVAIDMELLDDWARTVILVDADEVIAVRAKVFDVDRQGFWDSIGDLAGDLVAGLAGLAGRGVTHAIPRDFSGATGDAFDELGSFLSKKLAGGGDHVLFQGSARPDNGQILISGPGTNGRKGRGIYTLELSVQ